MAKGIAWQHPRIPRDEKVKNITRSSQTLRPQTTLERYHKLQKPPKKGNQGTQFLEKKQKKHFKHLETKKQIQRWSQNVLHPFPNMALLLKSFRYLRWAALVEAAKVAQLGDWLHYCFFPMYVFFFFFSKNCMYTLIHKNTLYIVSFTIVICWLKPGNMVILAWTTWFFW